MNILLVIADLGLGGAQQVVINLANDLVYQNHKVWVFDIKPYDNSIFTTKNYTKYFCL